jgi:hypothetical protein
MDKRLAEGLTDAAGFVGGALVGYWIAHLLGLELFDPGYTARSMAAIALVGIGGGVGVQVARRWRASRGSK